MVNTITSKRSIEMKEKLLVRIRISGSSSWVAMWRRRYFGEGVEEWRAGDLRKGGARKWKSDGFESIFEFGADVDLNDAAETVLNFVDSEIFREIGNRLDEDEGAVSFLFYKKERPALLFSRRTISRLAECGFTLDIDFFRFE